MSPHRWRRRLVICGLLAAALYVFHAPLLRGIASLLIVEDPLPANGTILLLTGHAKCYEEVAGRYQSRTTSRVLLLRGYLLRTERMGIVPTRESLTRGELTKRGVPEEAVVTLSVDEDSSWAWARRLDQWLGDKPTETVIVFCERLESRQVRHVLKQVLAAPHFELIVMRAMPNPCYCETDWWHRKEGLMGVFNSYLSSVYDRFSGETQMQPDWDPDEYERTLTSDS